MIKHLKLSQSYFKFLFWSMTTEKKQKNVTLLSKKNFFLDKIRNLIKQGHK